MTARALVLLASAAAALACNSTEPGSGSLTLVADHTSYVAPATVTVTLTNASSATVAAPLCATLQRQVGDVWTNLPTAPCPTAIRLLESGMSMALEIAVPEGSASGEYRAVMDISGSGSASASRIQSQPFSVQ